MANDQITYKNGEIRVGGKLYAVPWVSSVGGYVWDNRGNNRSQLSENLTSTGNMMSANTEESMVRQVRRALRRKQVRENLQFWLELSLEKQYVPPEVICGVCGRKNWDDPFDRVCVCGASY
jgi:hypothetical protein